MLTKTNSNLIFFILIMLLTPLAALLTFDDFMLRERTIPTTSVSEFSELYPEVSQNQYNDNTERPSPADQEVSRDNPPPAEDRVPGTPLTEEVKDELGISEDIAEEGVFFTSLAPNDPTYPQWYTDTISAPTAWDRTTGSSDVLVAVIDTGFGLDHEELAGSWFTNSGEIGLTGSGDVCWTGTPADKSTNGCDDDSNGYADDWRGWDFSNNDNNPQAGHNYAPGSSHGTKSAGLVAGRGNNGVGVASINWQSQILPLQALFDQGYGYSSDITNAIYYAVSMGADVINMSLGGTYPDTFTRAAVQYAEQNNVIVIASAGNCGDEQTSPSCVGRPSPGGMGYPARYPEVIAIGATTSSDNRASFSSWGDELDLVAPGSGSIQTPTWSTTNGVNEYDTHSYGTSFSSPIVAGAVALIKSEFPDITRGELKSLLAESSDKVGGMASSYWHVEYGYGRLNVANLLLEMDKYQLQLQKFSGQIAELSDSTKPLISTNAGHTSATIIGSSNVLTYCVATPQTLCSLTFDKQGSTESVVFGSLLTNNQGIAVFEWNNLDVSSGGTWDVTASANGQVSSKETLVIQ